MEKVKNIRGNEMMKCGDYYWSILLDGNREVYKLTLFSTDGKGKGDIDLIYQNDVLSICRISWYGESSASIKFKIPFDETPSYVNALINGEQAELPPLHSY